MADEFRVVVLCEGERDRSFLLHLLERLGIRARVLPAPRGKGSAEAWVRRQYPGEVKAYRSKANAQRRLGLLVMTDGDAIGLAARKKTLDDALAAGGVLPRTTDERIAVMVPTWSVETWMAWLVDLEAAKPVTEVIPLKDIVERARVPIAGAVAAWDPPLLGEPASLADGRRELARIAGAL